jgi:hypothetical protein
LNPDYRTLFRIGHTAMPRSIKESEIVDGQAMLYAELAGAFEAMAVPI